MAEIEWLGEDVMDKARTALAAGLNAAADVYVGHAITRVQASSFNPDGKLITKPQPSKPGQFPRSQTGQFRRSLTIARANPNATNPAAAFGIFDGIERPQVARYEEVGKGGKGYPTWLQTGTRNRANGKGGMRPRPWATLTVRQASGRARSAFFEVASRTFASQIRGAA